MLLIIFFVIGFGSYTVASNDDFLGGPDQVYLGPEAEIFLDSYAVLPLPPEAQVIGVIDGGFQDRFVLIKFTAPAAQIDAVLTSFNVSQADFAESWPNPFASEHDWWDIHTHAAVQQAEIRFGHFPDVGLSMVADPENPALMLFYLTAYEM